MKSIIKKVVLYVFVFSFVLFWNLIIQPVNIDEVWNYGFAHAISIGEIPYLDFNMVLTPLYPFIMAIGLKLFGSSMLIFHIEHAIVLTCFFAVGYKLFKDNVFLLFLLLIFPLALFFPSYNMFVLFLFSLLILLETKKSNDYLIGFILGLIILTKQSVGICISLGTFYYLIKKDWRTFVRRIAGLIIPCFIFLIYLLCTHSLKSFLNLCVLGLFDFANNNSSGAFSVLYFSLFIILVIINLVFIYKNKNNITYYYSLLSLSVVLPLIDRYHFYVGFIAFLVVFLLNNDIPKIINVKLFSLVLITFTFLLNVYSRFNDIKIIYPNRLNHFEYRFIDKDSIDFTNEVLDYMEDNKEHEFVFLNANAYFFRIIRDEKITYTDLINQGNWGYNSNKKILNVLSKKKDAIFFVQKDDLAIISQTNKDIIKYVLNNGKKIDNIRIYDVYVLER